MERTLKKDIGGKVVELVKPTPRIRALLRDDAKMWLKESTAENLRLAGVDADEIIRRLTAIDRKPLLNSDFIAFLNSDAGQIAALDQAVPDSSLVDEVDEAARLDLVAELWGLEITPVQPATEASPADPQTPLTWATPTS